MRGRSGLSTRSSHGRSALFTRSVRERSALFACILLYIVVLVNLMKGVCKQDTASTQSVCASVKLSQLLQ